MKKFLIFILTLLTLGVKGFPGNDPKGHLMDIHGWVFDVFTGDPVNHQWVYYKSYNNNAQPQQDSALTNGWGHYHIDSIFCQNNWPLDIEIFTFDCHQSKISYHISWYEPYKTLNFHLCAGPLPTCEAAFQWEADLLNCKKIKFYDHSQGNINKWYWNFGDGNSSDQKNPIHTYAATGTYQVILDVMDTISLPPCKDSDTMTVSVVSCNYFNLAGQVFAGSFPHAVGNTAIYLQRPEGYVFLDSCELNANGVYYFYQIPEGNYIVQVSRTSTGNPAIQYWPTYFGDKLSWQNSQLLNLQSDFYQGDIHLLQLISPATGPGSISGKATFIDHGGPEPAKDAEIVLADISGNFIDYVYTDSQGDYEFLNLPYGSYQLHAEIPGLAVTPVVVTLDSDQPHASDVMLLANNSPIGIPENQHDAIAGPVYPNPSPGDACIEINLTKSGNLTMIIFDIIGNQKVLQFMNLGAGIHLLHLPVEGLSSGTYFLSIINNDQTVIRRKFEIIR